MTPADFIALRQSLGLTQVAYENAVNYAKDRVQMRALSGAKRPDLAADPIIVHSDVCKMLLTVRANAAGARALVYFTAVELDKAHNHPDEKVRKDTERDYFMTAEEAKTYGIIDDVIAHR